MFQNMYTNDVSIIKSEVLIFKRANSHFSLWLCTSLSHSSL